MDYKEMKQRALEVRADILTKRSNFVDDSTAILRKFDQMLVNINKTLKDIEVLNGR